MPRQIPQSKYDALVAAFREHPGVIRAAARAAGVDKTTSMKAWTTGWPERGWPPINVILAGEQLRARALLASASEAEAKRDVQSLATLGAPGAESPEKTEAKKDGVSIRVLEAQAIRQARSNAMGLMGVTAKLLTGVLKLAEGAQRELVAQAAMGRADPVKVAKLCAQLAHSTIRGAEAAQLAMQMERLWLGQPTEIVAHKNLATDMSLDEVQKRIEAAKSAVDRARARGLTILTGGDQPGEKAATGGTHSGS